MKGLRLAVQTIGLALSLQTPIWPQSPCPVPDTHQVVPGVNIFDAQQQVYLADAIDASLRQDLVIETDPVVTTRLQAIVDHLAEILPPGLPKFQVALVELPTANAFSTIGGRIYVSRKLIALAQNEDELAYVLAPRRVSLFWLSGQGSDCPADGMRDRERLCYGGWVEKS